MLGRERHPHLHDLLTLRGAEVRDARIWSRYIAEAIELFADQTEVACASHHWPTWGRDEIVKLMTVQRDLYAYLHDQTLRRMNQGYVGSEIAEMMTMPPGLDAHWVGARLLRLGESQREGDLPAISRLVRRQSRAPVAASARRRGRPLRQLHRWCRGHDRQGQQYAEGGDLRFAAELASHAVFADPANTSARAVLADVFTRLGYDAETPPGATTTSTEHKNCTPSLSRSRSTPRRWPPP